MPDAETRPQQERTPRVVGETAALLAPLLEHVRDGVIFVDRAACVGFLNAVARQDIARRGDDPDSYPGRGLWELLPYPPEHPTRLAVEEAIRDGRSTHFSMRASQASGWVESDVVPTAQGTLLYYRDVTTTTTAVRARVESESNLAVATERLQTFMDEAPLAVMLLDNDARVLRWNPAAEAMFGWTAEEVIGQPLPTIPDEERAAFESLHERSRMGEVIRGYATTRRRKDGTPVEVTIASAPMHDREGRVVGAIAMVTDVTAQRKLEARLRMAQKMEAVGLLAGGVAHDFNNLLTAIKGFTSLLEMSIEDEQSQEFLDEITRAADRAATLTSQLLAFSRRQLLRPEPLDLNARVQEIERMLRLLLRDEGRLELELDERLDAVLADPGQIEQVIMNLVVNARDAIHGRAAGHVTIRTSNAYLRDEFDQWGVAEAPGHFVRLDVQDNGVGMDAETLARIFDPFFTTKEAGKGTGLGLATVYGIVKQSGGYVWAESTPELGTTFSVYLPRAKDTGREVQKRNSGGHDSHARILVVEDEDAVRRMVCRSLELQGYVVREAADAVEALAIAADEGFDLLLTDVMMPGMLGPTLAEEMRRAKRGLPVLFVSGHSEEIARTNLLDPTTPFLAKPFTPQQLVEKVRETLDLGAAVSS